MSENMPSGEGAIEKALQEDDQLTANATKKDATLETQTGSAVASDNDEDTAMKEAVEDDRVSEAVSVDRSSSVKDEDADMKIAAEDDRLSETASSVGRSSWDYSNRKVIVQNVYKYIDAKAARKMTSQWIDDINKNSDIKLEFEKLKKPPKDHWMVVTLKEESMVEPFIEYINKGNITNKKGHTLFAKRTAAATEAGSLDRRNKRKRNSDNSEGPDDSSSAKRQRRMFEEARRPLTDEEIQDAITPLWRLSPQDQLESKMKDMIKKCAMKVIQEIKARFRALDKSKNRKKNVGVYKWVKQQRAIDVQEIVPVPTPVRNKCEFSFGYRYLFDETAEKGEDGKQGMQVEEDSTVVKEPSAPEDSSMNQKNHQKVPAVGFMATGWAGGVVRPHCCKNISSEACAIADIVDGFLADSPLPPYDSKVHKGIWRTMTVRSSRRTKECMIIITHSPPSGGAGDEDNAESNSGYSSHFESEKQRLLPLLTQAELPVPDKEQVKVTSVFFQEYDGISSPTPDHPVQHAFGELTLHERLGKCTFQISPGAFFQVNTIGAELLYEKVMEKVREVSPDPSKTLLFDVCCGTGTIGISCLKEGIIEKVVGVDISEPAIKDARKNAELNGFGEVEEPTSKVRFVAARAEDVLAREIAKAKTTDLSFVAVVDPAREGLHPNVVKTLRSNQRISRIVYVSCHPTGSLVRDAGLLCAPPTKRYSGRAFRVESAQPVDMFPLTSHCEMIMTFDRLSGDEEDDKE